MKLMKTLTPLLILALLFGLILSACGDAGAADAGPPTLTDAVMQGKRLFSIHCASCHATGGDTVIVGPALGGIAETGGTHVDGLDAAAYIEQSVLSPSSYVAEGFQDIMPTTFSKQLTTEELNSIVAYTLWLVP